MNFDLNIRQYRGVDWRHKDLSKVCFDGCIITGSRFDGCILDGASFVNAFLPGSSFRDASLDGVCFDGSFLDGAWMDGTSLDGASFKNVCLDYTCLVRSRANSKTIWPEGFNWKEAGVIMEDD